jgi:hypothetical protein
VSISLPETYGRPASPDRSRSELEPKYDACQVAKRAADQPSGKAPTGRRRHAPRSGNRGTGEGRRAGPPNPRQAHALAAFRAGGPVEDFLPSQAAQERIVRPPGRTALGCPPCVGYGCTVLAKMSVRLARLPSFAIAKSATNELRARASPS